MVDDAITRDVEPLLEQLPFADGDVERIDALPRSFESFFAETRDPMLHLASLLTGSASQAEEAVQESFVRVNERWSSIDDPGAYLRRAVVNRCTSWHRHRAVVRRTDADVARAESYLDQPAETDELAAALAKLPGRRRAVVVLRFYQQLELADIADSLGVSVGTPTFVTAQPDYIPDVDATVLEGMTQADEEAYRAFADAEMRSCLAVGGEGAWNACLVSTTAAVKAYLAQRP